MCVWKNKKTFQNVSSWPSHRQASGTDTEGQKPFLNVKTASRALLGQIKDPSSSLSGHLKKNRASMYRHFPRYSSRLAGFAAQGLCQPKAISLNSTAHVEFFCYELLFHKRQFSISTNCYEHYLLPVWRNNFCLFSACYLLIFFDAL